MVNYLALLVVVIINVVLGMFWYSNAGFGKPWKRLMGIKEAKKKGMAKRYIGMIVTAAIMLFVLAIFVNYANAYTFMEGSLVGIFAWIGFIATTMFGTVLWDGKSLKLYWINSIYYLVSFIINGGILAIWV